MVESAYRTVTHAGNIPVLKRLRTDYYFSHNIISEWELGFFRVARDHRPCQINSYISNTPVDLFAEPIASMIKPEPGAILGKKNNVMPILDKQKGTVKDETARSTPLYSKPFSNWSISLRLGRSIDSHTLKFSFR
jgi:hypothetical protein